MLEFHVEIITATFDVTPRQMKYSHVTAAKSKPSVIIAKF